jgi:5'-3' exoribonuclease 2
MTSRFTWVYFLKDKSLVYEKFKVFRVFSKKERGQPIKFLGSDNGGEYVNRPFEEYLL